MSAGTRATPAKGTAPAAAAVRYFGDDRVYGCAAAAVVDCDDACATTVAARFERRKFLRHSLSRMVLTRVPPPRNVLDDLTATFSAALMEPLINLEIATILEIDNLMSPNPFVAREFVDCFDRFDQWCFR